MARFGRSFPVPRSLAKPLLGGIQFDAASTSAYQASVSSYSWSHTTTGTNRGLLVSVAVFAAGTVSGITYNSVAMTFVRSDTNGVYRNEIWKLANPASGTNTIAVTLSTSLTSIGSASSYTGVDQSNIVEANNGANGSNSTPTVSVTPVSNYSWIVDSLSTADATNSPVSQRSRADNSGALGTGAIADVGPVYPAGSTAVSWEAVGLTDSWAVSAVALKPYTASTTTTQTIVGVSRVTATTTKTQPGVARVTATTTRTQPGLSRITAVVAKTIPGLSRITATATKTQPGLSRITATTLKTIAGKARVTVTTIKTITGVSRITATTLATLSGKARITATTTQVSTGKARITATATQTVTGKSRITVTSTQTVTGVSKIVAGTVTTTKTQTGLGRIAQVVNKTQPAISRITATTSQTQTGKAYIHPAINNQTIRGKAKILSTVSRSYIFAVFE